MTDQQTVAHDLMVQLWETWRTESRIDSWTFKTHSAETHSIGPDDGVRLTFLPCYAQFVVTHELLARLRMPLGGQAFMEHFVSPVAHMFVTAMRDAQHNGVIHTQNILDACPPSAPYHVDEVFRWHGVPLNIQIRPINGSLRFRFILHLGTGL